MFRRVLIRKHERGLRFRQGHFIAPLNPGQHTLFVPPWDAEFEKVETVDTLKTRFDHPLLDVIVEDSELREQLVVVNLTESQRAVVYREGRVFALVGPGKHAFWKAPAEVEIEVFDVVGQPKFSHPFLSDILALPSAGLFLDARTVGPDENRLVAIDGGAAEKVTPGVHAFWRGHAKVAWNSVTPPKQPGTAGDASRKLAEAAGSESNLASEPALAHRLRELESVDATLSRFGLPGELGLSDDRVSRSRPAPV